MKDDKDIEPEEAPQKTDGFEEASDLENPEVDNEGVQTLAEWVLGGFIGLCFVGVALALLPAFTQVREHRLRPTRSHLNLREMSLAMHNYASANMRFPYASRSYEDGKPIHSWRVSLLPYLEQESLYDRYSFDEPWNGPNNSKLHDIVVPTYHCPDIVSAEADVFGTNYVVVTGEGTAFDGTKRISAKEVKDGLSNTLAIVEMKSSNTHWMEPVDITLEEMITRFSDKELAAKYCVHPGGIYVALLDGSVHWLSVPVDADELRNLIEIDDGNGVNLESF